MRIHFDEQLERLGRELITMGALIESAIAGAVKALMNRDLALAEKISADDAAINEKEQEIEALCLKLLLQQQPVARDLRMISSALKMITDMERIGDQAADIAELSVHLCRLQTTDWPPHISEMARATCGMVSDSVDAFVRRDLSLAQRVIASDDIVDDLFDRVRSELIERIRGNTAQGEMSLDLLMVAKYFERIGDHATNIAEWVEFSITGSHKSL
ncbi:MAG: phosphate signaling complex protein PhoU [Oscillospiraceae bacterium]